jgi:hypothetical protein
VNSAYTHSLISTCLTEIDRLSLQAEILHVLTFMPHRERFLLQAEILQESRMMIPDCQRRLEAAYTDLQQTLESEKDLEEAEEYKEARLLLDSVKLEP